MPRKIPTQSKLHVIEVNEKEPGAKNVVPVRLDKSSYRELIGIKGILITERKSNVTLSECVDELIRAYYENKDRIQMRK